ncbi:DUF87 domain-containing protein, partial [Candidatus Micrarchaeota archaeon]|nr:DUF87 domain-containing protein [Candidatus Micrarchaeota archaeon]MBU1930544.1 DUF87 domain-containing protein [Candidatus Micrarchaeota archaeon]
MEKTDIGTVVSSLNGPSPIELEFVVNHGNVHRGQFVELDYSEGTMVCMVTNVIKTNRYFERAEAVKEFEASGRKLFEQFPTNEWEYLLAKTRPLGIYHEKKLKRPSFPPSPGTKVRIASNEILKDFLGFEENGLHWGALEYHDLPVKLNLTNLLKKHIAILAQSGAGKCTSPFERVWLADGSEIPIGILVDEQIARGFVVDNGVQISFPGKKKPIVFSLAVDGTIKPAKVLAFMRRKAPKKMLCVQFRSGRKIDVSFNHQVPVLKGLDWEWIPAELLKRGDVGIVPKPNPTGFLQFINFVPLWKDSSRVLVRDTAVLAKLGERAAEKEFSVNSLAKSLKTDSNNVRRWLNHCIPMKRLSQICSILGLDVASLYPMISFLHTRTSRIPARVEVTPALAKLWAYWLAEGHNAVQHVQFSNENPVIQKEYIELMSKCFSIHARKSRRKGEILFSNSLLASSLKKMGFTNSSWTKWVPQQILKSDKKTIAAFLSTFIDCDGHVNATKSEIEITLASRSLIDALETMFFRFSVVPFLKQKKVKEKTYTRLLVRGSKNFCLLSRLEFKIGHKQERFLQWQKLVSNTNVDVVPNIGFELKHVFELLNLSYQNRAVSNISRCINGKDNLSRESLFRLCAEFENRVVQIERIVREVEMFFSSLPVRTETEAKRLLQEQYSNGNTFVSMASNACVSSATLRRVVRGLTNPTNSTISLAANLSRENEFSKVEELLAQKPWFKIKAWREDLGFELKGLCKKSGRYKNALYGYVTGHGVPPYSVLYRMTKELNQNANQLRANATIAKRLVKKMKNLVSAPLFFDPITQIEIRNPSYEFVYDLSTSSQNFVANKIVIHNSVSVKSLIEEVLNRKTEQGRIGIIVMDAHGEYTNFAVANPKNAKDFSSKTVVVNARDIRIGVPKLNVPLISSIVAGLSNPQKRVLQRILHKLYAEMKAGMGPFDFATVKKAISEDSEVKGETQTILSSWLSILEDLHLFAKTDNPSISDLLKPGQLTVIDFSDIIDARKKQVVVSHIANTLFKERRIGRLCPFLLVIEEAHQFAAERTREENAISRRIIETISR